MHCAVVEVILVGLLGTVRSRVKEACKHNHGNIGRKRTEHRLLDEGKIDKRIGSEISFIPFSEILRALLQMRTRMCGNSICLDCFCHNKHTGRIY